MRNNATPHDTKSPKSALVPRTILGERGVRAKEKCQGSQTICSLVLLRVFLILCVIPLKVLFAVAKSLIRMHKSLSTRLKHKEVHVF